MMGIDHKIQNHSKQSNVPHKEHNDFGRGGVLFMTSETVLLA